MLPNTTIMMHHPSGVARGQASDIQNEARELMRVRNYVNGVLSVATGQDQETVRLPTPSACDSLTIKRGIRAEGIASGV